MNGILPSLRSGNIKVGDIVGVSWLHHPRFVRTRDEILASLKANEVQFRKTKPVVFLCGGYDSARRHRIAQFLRDRLDLLVFYAEDVWNVIAHQPGQNALALEAQMALLADAVVLVVESPGTFAELGAFSLSPPLRRKLLPILDRHYQGSNSFIVTGPVRWVDADSTFAPTIWVSLDTVLDAANELEARLTPLKQTGTTLVRDVASSQKHILFFLCDLVAIFGPCPLEHLRHYVSWLLGVPSAQQTEFLIALGTAMNLIKQIPQSDMLFRPLDGRELRTFHRTPKYVSIPDLRAKATSILLQFPEGADAIRRMGEA